MSTGRHEPVSPELTLPAFDRNPAETVWISTLALRSLGEHAAERPRLETGGLLLGWEAGGETVICDVLGPGPGALHQPRRFVGDHEWQTQQLAHHYETSGRLVTYLGDWHTHPGGGTALSRRDRRTLRAIGRHPAARAPRALMLVLAGGNPWCAAAWRLAAPHRSRGHIASVALRPYEPRVAEAR